MPTVSAQTKRQDSQLLAKRTSQIQGGAARAAVLGVNDGLVSTVCIILAVAAVTGGEKDAVLTAGFAGLVAGAFSMAAGEWISVKSQVELFEGILADLRKLFKHDIDLLRDTLQAKLEDSGLTPSTAATAAKDMAKKKTFTDSYAVQVLGLNPDELGSPWTAASSSFALFTLGSLVALSPWFFIGDMLAVWLSIVFTALVSLVVGAYIAQTSGKSLWYGAFRQFMIVVLASIVTYGIGYAFGVVIA
ncbi:MAG: VIT1/CCC1 transporter family protein [Candidatus Saccharimonadales bacterium]